MSKIEDKMVSAVLNGKSFSREGTQVQVVYDANDAYHNAKVKLDGSEVAHYYYSLSDNEWVIRLTDGLKRSPVARSRLNALIRDIAKGGERIEIYDVLGDSRSWKYRMGANRYRWLGEIRLFAVNPN